MPLSVGQIINNRYRVVKVMAHGGFGTVYRVWDLNLKSAYALKENTEIGQDAQQQFFREAQILSNLNHPNLPRVTDHFILPGMGQFLVMDFIEGEDLNTKLIRQGRLQEAQLLPCIDQICDALIYLHSQEPPIVHRDIKPANIRITAQGKAYLVDFGIAKRDALGRMTTLGAKAITAGFSPPEQYSGGTIPRSDIYSLGATIYTLLSNVVLPESISRVIALQPGAKQAIRVVPLATMGFGISQNLSFAVMRAIEPDPANRFISAAEFRHALHQGVTKHSPSPGSSISPPTSHQQIVPPKPHPNPYGPIVSPPTIKPSIWQRIPKKIWIGILSLIMIGIFGIAIGFGIPVLRDQFGSFNPTKTSYFRTSPAAYISSTSTNIPPVPVLQASPSLTQMVQNIPQIPPTIVIGQSSPSQTFGQSQTATNTPFLPPTSIPTVPSNSTELPIGAPSEQNGVELIMIWFEARSTDTWEAAAFHVDFRFFNKTGQKLLVEWNTDDIYIQDSNGYTYVDWDGSKVSSTWVEAGGDFRFDRYYSLQPGKNSRLSPGTNTIWVNVKQFSRIKDASWRININPITQPITPPPGAFTIGDVLRSGNIEITVTNVDISTSDSYDYAALHVWYEIKNKSSSRVVVDIDYAYLYIMDSAGERFMDWEGGGIDSRGIDAGEIYSFDRWYTTSYHERSRITTGADFVVVNIEHLAGLTNAQWIYYIIR